MIFHEKIGIDMRQLAIGREILSKIVAGEIAKVNMSVTYACNYQCKTCNIWRIYLEYPELKDRELTLKDYDQLFKENRHLLWISFTGGEPFLRNDFSEIMVSALEKVEKLRVVNVVTNGSMPEVVEKSVCRMLDATRRRVYTFVEVSLDGVDNIHNDIRGVKDAYNRALETFLRLQSLKEENGSELFNVKLEYTISRFNAGLLETTINKLRDNELPIDINDFVVTFAHNSFFYRNLRSEVKPQADSICSEISWFFKEYQNRNLFDRITKSYLRASLKYFNGGWRPPCVAGAYSCFLDPFGNVYPCISMEYALGNLKKDGYSLHKISESPRTKSFKEKLRPSCPTCWTSCEAYQTIIFNFPHFLKDLV